MCGYGMMNGENQKSAIGTMTTAIMMGTAKGKWNETKESNRDNDNNDTDVVC